MKRSEKKTDCEILRKGLIYNDSGDNSELQKLLKEEQLNFCAYTEVFISSTYSIDIDHFNPYLKSTPADNYFNWFLISTKWNRKKGRKWENFQPVLHPASPDLEKRIWYEDGFYCYSPEDIEAKNLVEFLDINNYELHLERKKYIERVTYIKSEFDLADYFRKYPDDLNFRRAVETKFRLSL